MSPPFTSPGGPSGQPGRGAAIGIRIGHGYDLHRLERRDSDAALAPRPPGPRAQPVRPLVIGGVPFEHHMGPVGHSDGDVLLHAVTDAILGALGLPDIGQLFPDSDARWAGAASEIFVAEAMRLAGEGRWTVGNLDATVVLEAPRLGPHKAQIRQNLARLLNVNPDQANIKAKTHERVDAVGEGRAIEAHAVVLLVQN